MKLVVGCDGREQALFLTALAALVPTTGATVIFAHVVDPTPAEQWVRGAGHHWLRRQPDPRPHARFSDAAAQSAHEILAEALALSAGWTADRRIVELHGNPERELVKLALEERADLLVVGQQRLELGPHALGRCARFVVDHAPCPVLVVRDERIRAVAAALLGDRLRRGPKHPH